MRRAVAALFGVGTVVACNAISGVGDLGVGGVEAGVVEEDANTPTVTYEAGPKDPPDTGADVVVDANEAAAPSSVTISSANSPNNVNLTTEGTIDWMEWGEDSTIVPSRKVGGTDIIGVEIAPNTVPTGTAQDNGHKPYVSWTDGTPHATDNQNTEIGYAYGADDITLIFRVKSTPTPRNLALYLNTVRAKGTVEATFGAGRSSTGQEILDGPSGNPSQKRVLFTFSSADAAVLEIRFKLVQRYDNTNNLSGGRLGFFCASLFN